MHPRTGVYIDYQNVVGCGGRGLRFDVLREFLQRDPTQLIKLHLYLAKDQERYDDPTTDYGDRLDVLTSTLHSYGYSVHTRKIAKYKDATSGEVVHKGNTDMDMVVDMMVHSDHLERMIVITGDGDFVPAIKAIQNKGVLVEVIGFKNVNWELKEVSEFYLNGLLIPNLVGFEGLPIEVATVPWGEVGSRVRGVMSSYSTDKGYGFIRYIKHPKGSLLQPDTRLPGSAYECAFFHVHGSTPTAQYSASDYLNPDLIVECTLTHNPERAKSMPFSKDVTLVSTKA